jgi:hypothetical protein
VDEEKDKIKQYIDKERDRLDQDLHEIEARFKNATDFRKRFQRNPGMFLGATMAGGFMLAMLTNRHGGHHIREDSDFESTRTSMMRQRSNTSTQMRRASETVDNVFAALLGLAVNKLSSFVSDAIPGFREKYDELETRRGSALH